jgi:hypothetical protein
VELKKAREERASMRLVLTIIILAVLADPAIAAPSPPLSGTQLIKLCSTDILTCEKLIALIVKTGIDAGELPACTGALNLDELTGRLLDWWKLHPEKAENDLVRSVAYALRALKLC